MKVTIKESALKDLDLIRNQIATDNPRAAAAVMRRMFDSTERLGLFPQIGHVGRVPGTYEWVVAGSPYIVVYSIDTTKDELEVSAVFHSAKDR